MFLLVNCSFWHRSIEEMRQDNIWNIRPGVFCCWSRHERDHSILVGTWTQRKTATIWDKMSSLVCYSPCVSVTGASGVKSTRYNCWHQLCSELRCGSCVMSHVSWAQMWVVSSELNICFVICSLTQLTPSTSLIRSILRMWREIICLSCPRVPPLTPVAANSANYYPAPINPESGYSDTDALT